MIHTIYGDRLSKYPRLSESMFLDRAEQFGRRLNWPVAVDAHGRERDEYDALNPLYVIWQLPDGSHGGSLRFLPTVGPTMVNDHFLHLTEGVAVRSPLVWECTRFCVSQRAENAFGISAKLMLAGAALGRRHHLRHAVGVFDAKMIRIYRALGWAPDEISKQGSDIVIGLWDYAAVPWQNLHNKSRLTAAQLRGWIDSAPPAQMRVNHAGIGAGARVVCP